MHGLSAAILAIHNCNCIKLNVRSKMAFKTALERLRMANWHLLYDAAAADLTAFICGIRIRQGQCHVLACNCLRHMKIFGCPRLACTLQLADAICNCNFDVDSKYLQMDSE